MSGVRLCLFELLGRSCGIDLHRVAAVLPRGERVPLRDGPGWAGGAVLYQGQVVPLVALDRLAPTFPRRLQPSLAQERRRPGMGEGGSQPVVGLGARSAGKDLIVRLGRGALALPVDSVPRIERVEPGQLCVGDPPHDDYVEGGDDSHRPSRSGAYFLGWVEGLASRPWLLDVRRLVPGSVERSAGGGAPPAA